jgi:hypothetical protein
MIQQRQRKRRTSSNWLATPPVKELKISTIESVPALGIKSHGGDGILPVTRRAVQGYQKRLEITVENDWYRRRFASS